MSDTETAAWERIGAATRDLAKIHAPSQVAVLLLCYAVGFAKRDGLDAETVLSLVTYALSVASPAEKGS